MNERTKASLLKIYHFTNSWTGTVIIVLLVIFFLAQAFVIPSGSMISTMLIGDHLFVKKFAYGIPTPRIPWLEIAVLPDMDGDGHLVAGDKPERGDIVIFRYPHNEAIHYVKRMVAKDGDEIIVTGDTLLIRPHEGDEYIRATYPDTKIRTLGGKLFVENPYREAHPGIHYDGSSAYRLMGMQAMHGNLPMRPVAVSELGPLNDLGFNAFHVTVPKDEYFMMGDNRDHSNDSRFWGPVEYKYIVGQPWFVYFSWDDEYLIRWERMFKTIETLEAELALEPDRYKDETVTGLH